MMNFEIVPLAEQHIAGFHAMFDAVVRETKFFSFLEAPGLEETSRFVLDSLEVGNPHFVVLSGTDVVGWCDVIRKTRPVHSHCGTLGIGLLPPFRGHGVGRRLMETTIDAAWRRGMTRIELTVSEHNTNAIALYKSLGFAIEGLQRNAVRIDGQYQNVYAMALLKE
jgi:RimJ/RimL family protein N-acetyltransferase